LVSGTLVKWVPKKRSKYPRVQVLRRNRAVIVRIHHQRNTQSVKVRNKQIPVQKQKTAKRRQRRPNLNQKPRNGRVRHWKTTPARVEKEKSRKKLLLMIMRLPNMGNVDVVSHLKLRIEKIEKIRG
jgi:hypothetical protein